MYKYIYKNKYMYTYMNTEKEYIKNTLLSNKPD